MFLHLPDCSGHWKRQYLREGARKEPGRMQSQNLQGLMFATPYIIFEASQNGNTVLCFFANTCLSLQSFTDRNLERASKEHCSWPRNNDKKDLFRAWCIHSLRNEMVANYSSQPLSAALTFL